jgi:hypothetical protein
MEAMAPTPAKLGTARHVLAAVEAELAQPLLYARVDLLAAPTGEHLLGEVELVDPSLLLRFAAPAADRFARRSQPRLNSACVAPDVTRLAGGMGARCSQRCSWLGGASTG